MHYARPADGFHMRSMPPRRHYRRLGHPVRIFPQIAALLPAEKSSLGSGEASSQGHRFVGCAVSQAHAAVVKKPISFLTASTKLL